MKDIVKPNPLITMPDRTWETYDILVGTCNSLNALAGLYHRKPRFISKRACTATANALEKAQKVITILLEETGRMKEYEDWKAKMLRR